MDTSNSGSLENLLMLTNLEIIGTQVRLSEIVHKFEGGKWNDAQRKASQLVKSNMAMSYLDDVRKTVGVNEPKLNLPAVQQDITTEPVKPSKEVKTEEKRNHDNDIFEENYSLLNEFAPELEDELKGLTENGVLSGKSATNIHGSASIKSVEKDKYGYFLLLEINESTKPSQRIMLYANTTAKTVQVLSVESSDWKFEVYSDIRNRELVNLEQQEIQNKYFNKQLKKLIEFKLSIPTIDVTTIQEPKQEEENTIQFQFPRRGLQNVKSKPDQEWVPYKEDEEDDIDYDDDEDEFEKLQEENKALREENEELKEDGLFLSKSVFPTLYSMNFKLLRVLIPDLANELDLGLHSFTVYLEPQSDLHTVFKIDFFEFSGNYLGTIYEVDKTTNEEDYQCTFVIKNKSHAHFCDCSVSFLTLKKEMHVEDDYEVSERALQGNSALNNFFLTMIFHKFNPTIKDRVYQPEVVESPSTEVQEVKQDEESDGTGAVVAVLATIGLGILGFKLFK